MIEEYSEIKENISLKNVDSSFKLNDVQAEYLKELNIPSDIWNGMTKEDQTQRLAFITERFNEINLPQSIDKGAILKELYSPEIIEAYNRIEAPQDFIQIELISDVLSECKELNQERWQTLELSEKVSVLNELECKIAEIEHRPPCSVRAVNISPHIWGGFNPNSKCIDINKAYIEHSGYDAIMLKEVLDTLVHEGRHAYQDYNVNVCEIHPRHSEVISWAETMDGGKWGYYGDTSTKLGQRLYEQQSIEIDARNFAADILDMFEQKQIV